MISSIWSQIGVFVLYGGWLTGIVLDVLAVSCRDRLVSVGKAPNSFLSLRLLKWPKNKISIGTFLVLVHDS